METKEDLLLELNRRNRKAMVSGKSNQQDDENLATLDRGYARNTSGMYYNVEDNPPIHLAFLFGFQVAVANIFSCVNMAVILSSLVCADKQFTASLYATTAVMSGLGTILQTSFGVRLPVFQGPSILFMLPYINAAENPAWGCETSSRIGLNLTFPNSTNATVHEQPWLPEWQKVQGSLMLASVLHIAIGLVGLGGLLLRLMGPISVTCLIFLLGLSVHGLIAKVAEIYWGISCLNIAILIILSQYINKIRVPVPTWTRRQGFSLTRFPLFELFPVLIAVITGWIISHIFTISGVFPDDPTILQYQARTDFDKDSIREAPVLLIPYPGQFGAPSFKLPYAVMMTIAVCGSILESVGDYVQTTAPCRVPVPPAHAINRGIIMEGIASVLCGAMGAGHAMTSFSNMIGMIGITKVASRRVFNIAGLLIIIMGVCGKLGAVFVTIPQPVLAGPLFISISLLVGAALSNLRKVDLFATRSQAVLGIAIMGGMVFPNWLEKHPGVFDTGLQDLDQTLQAFLSMPLVVGVVIAIFLDVTIPGLSITFVAFTMLIYEYGKETMRNSDLKVQSTSKGTGGPNEGDPRDENLSLYDPPFLGKWLSKWKFSKYLSFLPSTKDDDDKDTV